MLEAASQGCALVLGDIPSLRENWDEAALFVAPDDRQQLVAAIAWLIASPARRLALGARAMSRAAEFTVRRMASAYVNVYASAHRAHSGGYTDTRRSLVTTS